MTVTPVRAQIRKTGGAATEGKKKGGPEAGFPNRREDKQPLVTEKVSPHGPTPWAHLRQSVLNA